MLTIMEAAKFTDNSIAQGVVETFARENPVLERMPFVTINGNAFTFRLEDTLPGVAFRGVNESYTESTGVITMQTEALKIAGGDSDFDKFLVATANDNGLRAAHDQMKSKAMALTWLKTFFDGNTESEPREFDGLNRRLTGAQIIDAGNSGGAALTLAKLDELIDAVDGSPDVLLMNKTLRREVNKLVRAAGQAIETVSDSFGRRLEAYAGIPIAIIGDDASGTPILDFDEDDGGGNEDTASIYAARFGLDTVHGIQNGTVDARDLGELETRSALRTRVEWFASFVVKNGKSAARLRWINQP